MGTNLLSEFRGRCGDYCLVNIACLSTENQRTSTTRGTCWWRFVIANARRHSNKNSIYSNFSENPFRSRRFTPFPMFCIYGKKLF